MCKLLPLLASIFIANGKILYPTLLDHTDYMLNAEGALETDNFHTSSRSRGTRHDRFRKPVPFGDLHGPRDYLTFDFGTTVKLEELRIKANGGMPLISVTSHDKPCIPEARAQIELYQTFNSFPQTIGEIKPTGTITRSDFTASAWVYRTASGSGDYAIFGTNGENKRNQNLHFVVRNNKYYMGFYANDCASETINRPNTWEHVAFVYKDRTQKIYVNGELVKSCSGKDAFGAHRFLPLYLGDARFGADRRWRGMIRDVKVHSRGLSDFEVRVQAGGQGDESLEGLPACKFHIGEPRGEPVATDHQTEDSDRLEQRWTLGDNEGRLFTIDFSGAVSQQELRWIVFEGEEVTPSEECDSFEVLSVEVDANESDIGADEVRNVRSLTVEQNGCGHGFSLGTPSVEITDTTEVTGSVSIELQQSISEAFGTTTTETHKLMVGAGTSFSAGGGPVVPAKVEVEVKAEQTWEETFEETREFNFGRNERQQTLETTTRTTVSTTSVHFTKHVPWTWRVYEATFLERTLELQTTFRVQCVYKTGRGGPIRSIAGRTFMAERDDVQIRLVDRTGECPQYNECKCIKGLNSDYIFGETCTEHPSFPGRQGCYVGKAANCGNRRGLGTATPVENQPVHIDGNPSEDTLNTVDYPVIIAFEWSYVPCGHTRYSEADIMALGCQRFEKEECKELGMMCRWLNGNCVRDGRRRSGDLLDRLNK